MEIQTGPLPKKPSITANDTAGATHIRPLTGAFVPAAAATAGAGAGAKPGMGTTTGTGAATGTGATAGAGAAGTVRLSGDSLAGI